MKKLMVNPLFCLQAASPLNNCPTRRWFFTLLVGVFFSNGSVWAEPTTLKSAAQKAVLSNPEVLARYHALKASEGELGAVTSAMLPHLDFTASKGREDRNDPLFKGSFSEYSRSLQLSQLLWDGLGSWYQKRQFDHARLVRLFEFFDASESAALEVSRAYFDVLRYRKLVELAEDNYVQHRSVYEQIEARVKAGVGRRVDFEQAAGRLALSESNLIVDISNLHDVSARYQRLVGEPPAKVLEMPPSLSEGVPESIKAALERTYALNPQVRAAVENVRASAYARDVRRSAYQPKLELRLREDRGSDLNGFVGQTKNHVAEVLLNFNIFNGFGDKGRVDQGTEQYNTARDQRDKACRDVRQTLEIAYNDVRKLVEQKNYLEQHRLSVEKARDAYRKQFDIGQRSLLDLLDTENELFEARRAEANADLDLATSYARVHGGEGRLLAALGLTSVDNELTAETSDWALGEESPEQCPPEPVLTYVADKAQLNERAAEMTRDKVKAMLDAIAARREAGLDSNQNVSIMPSTAGAGTTSVAQFAERAVTAAMAAWAKAWMDGDVAAYLASYAPDFKPVDSISHADWVRSRTAALSRSKEIKLAITGQKAEVREANTVVASFHQSYSSSTYADEVDKTIIWRLFDTKWLIVSEANATSPPASVNKVKGEKAAAEVKPVIAPVIPKIGSEKEAISAWAEAWRVGDAAKFDARYAVEFVASNGLSRGEWVSQEMRKSAFSRSKGIRMSVSDVAISPSDTEHANATLTQHYESADYKQNVNKELMLGKVSGDWKIFKEAIVSLPETTAEPQPAPTVNVPGLPMPPGVLMGLDSPATPPPASQEVQPSL